MPVKGYHPIQEWKDSKIVACSLRQEFVQEYVEKIALWLHTEADDPNHDQKCQNKTSSSRKYCRCDCLSIFRGHLQDQEDSDLVTASGEALSVANYVMWFYSNNKTNVRDQMIMDWIWNTQFYRGNKSGNEANKRCVYPIPYRFDPIIDELEDELETMGLESFQQMRICRSALQKMMDVGCYK